MASGEWRKLVTDEKKKKNEKLDVGVECYNHNRSNYLFGLPNHGRDETSCDRKVAM